MFSFHQPPARRAPRVLRALASLLLLAVPAGLRAQAYSTQPIVLQHGFLSDAPSWDPTSTFLQQQSHLYLRVHRWTTGWTRPLGQQADILRAEMQNVAMPDTAVIIGHSNGGLIARWASFDKPLKAIVTIGTLHGGARLAQNVLDGSVYNFGNHLRGAARGALDNYDFPPCCEDWQDNFLWEARSAAYIQEWLGIGIMSGEFLTSLTAAQVLFDMGPGSNFLNQLNAAPRFTHEQQTVAYRAGVSSRLPNPRYGWVIWYGMTPDYEPNLTYLTDWTISTEFYAYDYYRFYNHPADPNEYYKRQRAQFWFWAAAALNGLDVSWCGLIGALNENYICLVSDGIVPVSSQRYPGATDNFDIFGYPHMKEKNSTDFQEMTESILRTKVRVAGPPSSNPPSSGGLNVGISGPTSISPWQSTTWSATVSNGTPPYTYQWFVDNGDFGTESSINTAFGPSSQHEIRLEMTDAQGVQGSQDILVFVSSGNCPPDDPNCIEFFRAPGTQARPRPRPTAPPRVVRTN